MNTLGSERHKSCGEFDLNFINERYYHDEIIIRKILMILNYKWGTWQSFDIDFPNLKEKKNRNK